MNGSARRKKILQIHSPLVKVCVLLCVVLCGCGKGQSRTVAEMLVNDKDFANIYQSTDRIKYIAIDIDGDEREDLVACCDGDYSAAGIALFRIDEKQLRYISTFGSYARCEVAQYKDDSILIHSDYGNGGCFYDTFSIVDLKGFDIELLGAVFQLSRIDSEKITYYDVRDEDLTGDRSFDYLGDGPDHMTELSKEEYDKRFDELRNTVSDWVKISYDMMQLLNPKNN